MQCVVLAYEAVPMQCPVLAEAVLLECSVLLWVLMSDVPARIFCANICYTATKPGTGTGYAATLSGTDAVYAATRPGGSGRGGGEGEREEGRGEVEELAREL
eukprot:3934844-Rhodomonas_salina.1